MHDLIASLMALITSFVPGLGGTPQNLPPVDQSEFLIRGQQIRDIVKSFNPSTSGPTGSSAVMGPTGATGATALPDNNRLPADNLNSRIRMPALIPQNAIENSSALDFSQGNYPTPGNRGRNDK